MNITIDRGQWKIGADVVVVLPLFQFQKYLPRILYIASEDDLNRTIRSSLESMEKGLAIPGNDWNLVAAL
jgi:hypothetical protein